MLIINISLFLFKIKTLGANMNLKKIMTFFFVFFLFQVSIFADIINFESLPEAVSSEANEKEYSFNGTQIIDVDLGELKGILLTINGTQNVDSVINSTGTYGITLSSTLEKKGEQ